MLKIGKMTSLFFAAGLFVISYAGCGGGQRPIPPPSTGTVTVVDMAGRTVEIPENVESIALVHGVITSYIVALGKADKLAAVVPFGDFYRLVDPVFETVGTIGRAQVDMEAIAQLNPDLFIHRASDTNTLDAVQRLGIPSIGVQAESHEDITAKLSLLGKALGAGDRADELIAYYSQLLDKAQELSRDIPDEKRKNVIVMGTRIGSVANGAMLQSFIVENAGGINRAKDVVSTEIWPVVGTETIFGWDPDFIFITNSIHSNYSVETLLSDPAWANLTAVRERNVYRVPAEKDSWEFPGISSALGALWMLRAMYPDRFGKEQVNEQAKEFYKKVYNLDATPELLGY